MKTSILTLWAVILIIIGILTLSSIDNKTANIFRLITPILGIVGIYLIEYICKLKDKRIKQITIFRVLAAPLLVLGFNWLSIFTLTEYREHHRIIILPLSICFISVGMILTHFNLIKRYNT